MAETKAGGTKPPQSRPASQDEARLARRAEALRANLRRRKAQSRGRADQGDDDGSAAGG